MSDKNLEKYPAVEHFRIKDTIGVPHPFCITHHHVAYASDGYSGMLGDAAIEGYEAKIGRASCGMRGCNLMYKEHETALLVECDVEDNDALNEYLLSIKEMCEADGFAGFAFIKSPGFQE